MNITAAEVWLIIIAVIAVAVTALFAYGVVPT